MRVFLVANILFTAAHRAQGKARFLIHRGGSESWEVVSCSLAVEEAVRNLELKVPSSLVELDELLQLIRLVETVVEGICPLELPDKDGPIYLSARESESTHLLTGDRRHFGAYMNRPRETEGLLIQTVADFFADFVGE